MNNHELNYLSEELIKHNYELRLASVVISKTTVTHLDHHTGEYFEFTMPDQFLAETLFLFFAAHMEDMLSTGVHTINVECDAPEFMYDENQWEPGHFFIGMRLLDNTTYVFWHDDLRLFCTFNPCIRRDTDEDFFEYVELPEDISDDELPF